MRELEDLSINCDHHWLYAIGGGQLTPWYFRGSKHWLSRLCEPEKALGQGAAGADRGKLSDWHAQEWCMPKG